MTKMKRYP